MRLVELLVGRPLLVSPYGPLDLVAVPVNLGPNFKAFPYLRLLLLDLLFERIVDNHELIQRFLEPDSVSPSADCVLNF